MDPVKLKDSLLRGDRRALAQAITFVESDRLDQREERFQLLQDILPSTGKSLRLGISGVPGVGKSTLLRLLVFMLLNRERKWRFLP